MHDLKRNLIIYNALFWILPLSSTVYVKGKWRYWDWLCPGI